MQLTKVDIAGLIVVGLLLVWQDVHSDDFILHGGSKHFGGTEDYNESNSGVGYSHDVTTHLAVRGGVYVNSYNRDSVYIGAAASTAVSRWLDIGIQGGAVAGYAGTPEGSGSVSPFCFPYLRGRHGRLFGEIGYIPAIDGVSVVTYSVGVSW